MPGYYDYKYKSRLAEPEDMTPSYLGGQEMASNMGPSAPSEGTSPAANMATAGATGAMMGGPAGAAVGVGGAFLTSYLANRAANERAKRDRAAQIENQYAQNQNQGFDTMMRSFQGALR